MRLKFQIRHSISLRLLASYLFFAFAPVLLVGWMLSHTAGKAIKETILNRNQEIVRKSAEQIETTITHAEEILHITAQNPALYRMNRFSQELTINNLVQGFPIFIKVSLVDTLNNVITSTKYAAPYSEFENRFLDSIQISEKGLSSVYLSGGKLPCMLMVHPIHFRKNVVGRLLTEIGLRAMWDIVDRDVLGHSGESFVINKDGKYLAHSNRRKVYLNQHLNQTGLFEDIVNVWQSQSTEQAIISRDSISFKDESQITKLAFSSVSNSSNQWVGRKEYRRIENGEQMIAAYAVIKNLKWGLVIQQPATEALHLARQMRMQVLMVIAGVLVAAAILAYLYTRRIVNPVRSLVAGIEHFSTGNLKHRISVEAEDEIGTLSAKFNDMADRLLEFQNKLRRAERMETLGKMASMISHEIRNPLNSMVINLQIIKREIFKANKINIRKINKYYEIVTSEIARIEKLVKDFLLISKPAEIEKKATDIREIINDVVNSQLAETTLQNVTLECPFRNTEAIIAIDRERMRQVFLNIYLNALQTMPEGGKLKIEVSPIDTLEGYISKSWTAIDFTDTGKGIPQEELDKIFDFYYSTKSSGTGLGLTIVQQIIEEHGGHIKVICTIGQGTCIRILLPQNF